MYITRSNISLVEKVKDLHEIQRPTVRRVAVYAVRDLEDSEPQTEYSVKFLNRKRGAIIIIKRFRVRSIYTELGRKGIL